MELRAGVEMLCDGANHPQGRRLVVDKVVDDSGLRRVHDPAPELLFVGILTSGGLYEGRAAQVDGAITLDDDALVAHRGNVGGAGRAHAQDRRNLRDVLPRHQGLVLEGAPALDERGGHHALHLRGVELCATAVHEVDRRKQVLQCDRLGPILLREGLGTECPATDGGVVRDEHALPPVNDADACDDCGAVGLLVPFVEHGERTKL
mmetsp:Transcript_112526/g.317817  ORF Transcript_112526/g.317817 Transcript_112526/m.317817 type:complete len:206 (-) Transcript_112526:1673-2290(-)